MSTDGGQGGSAYPKSIQAGIPKIDNPAGWPTPKIGALLKVVQRPVRLEKTKEYRLVTARRSRGGIVRRETLLGKDIATPSQFEIAEGDFLISRRQIAHGACGIVPAELAGSIVSNEYATLRPTAALDPGFLKHLTASIYFQQTCFHSSIGVHVEKLVFDLQGWLRWPIAVPEPPEQRRIAAVLDAWDEAIATAKELVLANERLGVSVMQNLVGDCHNPFQANGQPLGEIVSVEYGKAVAEDDYSEDGSSWILGTQGKIGTSHKADFVGEAIVVGRKGTLNKPIYVPPCQPFRSIDTTFVLKTDKRCRALFFYLRHIDLAKLNAASGVPSVSGDTLKSLPIPNMPDILESAMTAVDQRLVQLRTHATFLVSQKRGLMQKLLTGQWRVPESIDALLPKANKVAA